MCFSSDPSEDWKYKKDDFENKVKSYLLGDGKKCSISHWFFSNKKFTAVLTNCQSSAAKIYANVITYLKSNISFDRSKKDQVKFIRFFEQKSFVQVILRFLILQLIYCSFKQRIGKNRKRKAPSSPDDPSSQQEQENEPKKAKTHFNVAVHTGIRLEPQNFATSNRTVSDLAKRLECGVKHIIHVKNWHNKESIELPSERDSLSSRGIYFQGLQLVCQPVSSPFFF